MAHSAGRDRLTRSLVWLQSLLPQHLLSWLVYQLTRWRWTAWKNFLIRLFIRHYQVDMGSAVRTTATEYEHFNDFFTRELRADARPIRRDQGMILSPVDGQVSEAGTVSRGNLLQAKDHHYSLAALLTDPLLATRFDHGSFATLYLSPRDYHRIHMPCAGTLQRMIHVPGRRFAVNTASVAGIPGLFARNERLVNLFETAFGPMAVIMVGALCVGSMQTVWTGELPVAGRGLPRDDNCAHMTVQLQQGEEMGRFNMGSTVILLFAAGRVQWQQKLQPPNAVVMGGVIGTIR